MQTGLKIFSSFAPDGASYAHNNLILQLNVKEVAKIIDEVMSILNHNLVLFEKLSVSR